MYYLLYLCILLKKLIFYFLIFFTLWGPDSDVAVVRFSIRVGPNEERTVTRNCPEGPISEGLIDTYIWSCAPSQSQLKLVTFGGSCGAEYIVHFCQKNIVEIHNFMNICIQLVLLVHIICIAIYATIMYNFTGI